MFLRVTSVRHTRDYQLEIVFADGVRGEIDFAPRIVGRNGVFLALQDVTFHAHVRVDPEAGTLVWPNDVDFDPDVLYGEVTGIPLPVLAVPLAA